MIRNSVDHGIETEAERAKAGKPATGSIVITTYTGRAAILLSIWLTMVAASMWKRFAAALWRKI